MTQTPSSSSSVAEDYLKMLYSAEEWEEGPLGVTDLARRMGVVASTASENVRKLQSAGLVEHSPYQKVRLTDQGRSIAVDTVRRHRVIETYLHEKLGFDWDEVDREAETLEHVISDALLDRMDAALGRPDTDPHGDPIPQPGKSNKPAPVEPLREVREGTTVTIGRINDADPELLRYLESLRLLPGTSVTVVEKLNYAGSTKLQVENVEEICELGDIAADAIWVRK